MSSARSPTVSRRWLAREMKRLRIERGLQQPDVAEALGCRVPKVSHIENEQRLIQPEDLKTLLELFEVPDDSRQQYLDELVSAHRKGWWEHYDEATMPAWLSPFLGLEQGAERLRAYQPALIHGLLQTADYAAGIYRGLTGDWSEEKIKRYVELRLRRQQILFRHDEPAKLTVVLDEAALRHVVGNREVMGAQLSHLADLCEARENITVQVVPFDRGGSYEAAYGSFTILNFPLVPDPGVVYMEHHLGGTWSDGLPEIDKYSGLFQQLTVLGLSAEESMATLRGTAESYRRSS